MTKLLTIELGSNHLTGSIPDSLGNCAILKTLELLDNHLMGSIPDSLGQCRELSEVYLESNLLTGTIPNALGACSKLEYFELNDNKLTGTVPASVGNFTRLTYLLLYNNVLEGTIPNFGQCAHLTWLYLDNNKFTGTIPETLCQCKRLQNLDLHSNPLTGSIPDYLATCAQLSQVNLYHTQLTGSIPASIGRLAKLTYMDFSSNLLSGSIPDALGQCKQLLTFNLNNNQLTGSIPVAILQGPQLFYLYLFCNHLTGTIPSIQGLGQLQVLMLQYNKLRGNITQLFDPLNHLSLITIQLSSNYLTGTLPAAAFALPSLSSFAAVDNCFEGPLPEEAICSSTTLTALVLDGLHSASSCRHRLSLFTKAFKLGTVPSCLFSMPNLTTLHLSGSGLTGSLPAEASISAVLTDLSLSHNLLKGEIPGNFLDRGWAKLDLSNNRLTGTLHSAETAPYDSAMQLFLKHNLLSGSIPGTLRRVGSLSLLESNLFSCRADRGDVPQQDPDSNKYTCGSDAVNNALFAWLVMGAMLVAISGIAWYRGTTANLQTWFNASLPVQLSGLRVIFRVSDLLTFLGAANATYCVLVLLPVYATIAAYYPTFTYKYAWTVSGAFLAGVPAFAVEVTFLFVLLISCELAAQQLLSATAISQTSAISSVHSLSSTRTNSTRLKLEGFAVLLFSTIVVFGINTGFVFATLKLNGRELTVIQILLAVFKLGFNKIIVPAMKRRANAFNPEDHLNPSIALTSTELLLVLLNVILIPCLVVVFISPDCFYNALAGTETVTSSYSYSSNCQSFVFPTDDPALNQTVQCAGAVPTEDNTEYQPGFTYSYQCSSSFVTYYAPTFVIMCIISGFLAPAQRWLLLWLRHSLSPSSRLYSFVTSVTPRILKELPSPEEMAASRKDPHWRPVFNANQLLISLLTYLALLLTFGALFPPLALCCAVAMASMVLLARLEVGRYVTTARAAGRQDCVDEMERACVDVIPPQQLRAALTLLVTVSCLFYTLFLFDTLGDEVGFAGAFWVLIVVPVMPLLVQALHWLLRKDSTRTPMATELALETDVDPEFGSEMRFSKSSVSAVNSQATRASNASTAASNPLHKT